MGMNLDSGWVKGLLGRIGLDGSDVRHEVGRTQ
jgi:hypothetical protein